MIVIESIKLFFEPLHQLLSKYLIDDKWFYIPTCASVGGYSVDRLLFSNVLGVANSGASLIESFINNPIPYVTALTVVGTFVVSVWQKIRADKREQERHDLELKIKEVKAEKDLKKDL